VGPLKVWLDDDDDQLPDGPTPEEEAAWAADAATQRAAWLADPAAWVAEHTLTEREREHVRAAESDARAVDVIHHHATGTHGGGGPGYAFQYDGGGITVADSYADTHDPSAERRRVTLVSLVRRIRQPLDLFALDVTPEPAPVVVDVDGFEIF
jgi:hypothetical protein